MTKHLASTRNFPRAPYWQVVGYPRPLSGGAVELAPLPPEMAGPRYKGLDPSDPTSWVRRPYNPQPGMIGRLNFDGAKHQAETPMGGVWRNPMTDRKDVQRRRRRRGRRLWRSGG